MKKARPNALTLRLGAATIVLVILLCLTWTLWLMALTFAPNETANRILRTRDLDGGTFWHFSEMPIIVGPLGIAGLSVAALGYVYVLWVIIKLLCREFHWRLGEGAIAPSPTRQRIVTAAAHPPIENWTSIRRTDFGPSTTTIVGSFISRSGLRRHTRHLLHCVILVQLLEAGMPVSLIAVFATIAAIHSLVFAIMFFARHRTAGLLHLLLDTVFDLVVAIGFPMLVLVHSLSLFNFDMELMAINERVFTPGSFERYAAVVADPLEVVAVRRSLVSLQVNSWLSVVTRVGTMLMLVRRLHQVARLLEDVWTGHVTHVRGSSYGQHRWLGVIFGLGVLAIVLFTEESVRTAALACQPHPECAQHAHRWIVNMQREDLTRCPCLAIVDRITMVATYDEWVRPPNSTLKVAQLATTGMLHTLQLMNRGLTIIPEELRRCKHLRHVSFYYTNTESLPDWFGEFTELEFLHIEGKYPLSSLVHVPDNMFDRMSALTFLHLAIHALDKLPSFEGASALKSLSLAGLPHVTTFPRLNTVRNLQQLTVIAFPRLSLFPDLTNLHQLMALSVADRGAFCCNGFLGPDKCNLSRSLCQHHQWSGAEAVTQCVSRDNVASLKTRAAFDRFNTTACYGEALAPSVLRYNLSYDDIVQCNGTLYRECRVVGVDTPAMCYNTRWTVIACHEDPMPIEMRRQQMKLGLGRPCNPEYEAWLGCENPSV